MQEQSGRSIGVLDTAMIRFWLLSTLLSISLICSNLSSQVSQTGALENTSGGGGPPGGQVSAIVINPHNSAVVYVGTESGGIFKSTDKGVTWAGANSGITDNRIYALAIDPYDSSTLYAATGDGVFKSANDGARWIGVSVNRSPFATKLLVAPSKPVTVYSSSGFLFSSNSGGASWKEIKSIQKATYIHLMAIDPRDPSTIYAGISRPPDVVADDDWHGNGLYRSANRGESWTQISSVSPTAMAISVSPSAFYVASDYGITKSTDNGKTWKESDSGLSNAGVRELVIDPTNPAVVYAITGHNSIFFFEPHGDMSRIFKSTDRGETWKKVSSFPAKVLAVDPSDSATVYAGTPNGVFKSSDGGVSWNPSNSGLSAATVRGLAVDPHSPSSIYAVASGVFRSTDAGDSWTAKKLKGIDWSSHLAMAPSNSSIFYVATMSGILKSIDKGESLIPVVCPFIDEWVSSLAVDPFNPSVLYAGTHNGMVHLSTDGGGSWEKPISRLTGNHSGTVIALLIDSSNPATIYAGTNEGRVFKSSDRGKNWNTVYSGSTIRPAVSPVYEMVMDRSNPSIFYAATSGGGVFKSVDEGGHWTKINSGMGEITIEALAVDPSNPAMIYAGSRRNGVFRSFNRGESWTPSTSGLPPNMDITALAIGPSDPRTIYAGTEGAGVFKSTNGGETWQPTGTR